MINKEVFVFLSTSNIFKTKNLREELTNGRHGCVVPKEHVLQCLSQCPVAGMSIQIHLPPNRQSVHIHLNKPKMPFFFHSRIVLVATSVRFLLQSILKFIILAVSLVIFSS